MTGFPEHSAVHGGSSHGAVAPAPVGTAPGPDDAPCPGGCPGPVPVLRVSSAAHHGRRAEATGA